MADPLGTVLQVVEVVGKAVEIWKKIKDAPEQVQRIGKRMAGLNTTLVHLEGLLRTNEKRSLARLGPGMTVALLDTIEDIRKKGEAVQVLFVKFDKNIGPLGLEFRSKFIGQAYFALGNNSSELQQLSDDIKEDQEDLDRKLNLMIGIGMDHLVQVVGGQGSGIIRQPSPLPSGETPRADFRIIFVDPYNVARSMVAEAYTNLLREWTIRTGGNWRVKTAHSAGFFVSTRNEVVDTIKDIKFLYPSYQLALKDGWAAPQPTSLAALFDNKMFDYPYKRDVKAGIESRRSRGLTKTMFKTYDYILVFTDREEDNLIRLRKLLINKDGREAVTARGKGKVMHLGRYRTKDGTRKEITAPKNDGDRQQWNDKVGQIKLAIKAFLKGELDWKQPPKGANPWG